MLQVQEERNGVFERLHLRLQVVSHGQVSDLPGQPSERPEEIFDSFLEELHIEVDPERLRPLVLCNLEMGRKAPSARPLGDREGAWPREPTLGPWSCYFVSNVITHRTHGDREFTREGSTTRLQDTNKKLRLFQALAKIVPSLKTCGIWETQSSFP